MSATYHQERRKRLVEAMQPRKSSDWLTQELIALRTLVLELKEELAQVKNERDDLISAQASLSRGDKS